jgi:sortase A
VTLGLLILLFVAYQLWGTGILTARAQHGLKQDFAKAQQAYAAESTTSTTVRDRPPTTVGPTTSTTQPVRPAPPVPPQGEVEGVIKIPRISLNIAFVEGVSRDDLKKGPGHYPDTPLPGTLGNAAIAGHRTTFLHPFYDVDKLKPNDDIIVETVAGTFTYKVYAPDPAHADVGHLIVKPTDVQVVDNTPNAQLTLTSCNPKFSAEQRIVIKARLAPNESAKPARPQARRGTNSGGKVRPHQALMEEGLSGQERSLTSAVRWGLGALVVGLAWWWAFRRWRHPITWIVGVVPFLAVLFAFYVYFEQALPAGY